MKPELAQKTEPPSRAGAPEGHLPRDLVFAVGLAALAVAVLWPVVRCGFVNYDDPIWVTDNPRVQQGLNVANIGWAFTQAYGYWTPIDVLSHMADCQFFGLAPTGHHVVNLLFHACNAALLFLLLRRTTGRLWCAAFAAALFAIHPLNVEPVAWITSRKDVLSTFLGLLTLLAYARYAAKPGVRCYVPVLILFTLSLMDKPAFMPLPVIMLFLDYWPLNRIGANAECRMKNEEIRLPISQTRNPKLRKAALLVAEKLPLLAIVAGFAALDFVTQRRFGSVNLSAAHPFVARAANAAIAYVWYLWKALWPGGLAIVYPYPTAFSWLKVSGALLLLAAVTTCALLCRKRCPYVLVGWFWYGLVLLPVCGLLVQIGDISTADRYAYVSMIGVFVIAAWGLGDLATWTADNKKGEKGEKGKRGNGRTEEESDLPASLHFELRTQNFELGTLNLVFAAVAVAALAGYAVAANIQARYWRDSETVLTHAIEVTRNNAFAYNNRGIDRKERGQYPEAIADLEKAIEIDPFYQRAHNNLANALLAEGRTDGAIDEYRKALAIDANYPKGHNNLGQALALKGRYEEAIAEYQRALALKPDYAKPAQAIRQILSDLENEGDFAEAIACYARLIKQNPADAQPRLDMARLLVRTGKLDEAVQQYMAVVGRDPANRDAYFNLGMVNAARGKRGDAIKALEKVLELDPGDAKARQALERVRAAR